MSDLTNGGHNLKVEFLQIRQSMIMDHGWLNGHERANEGSIVEEWTRPIGTIWMAHIQFHRFRAPVWVELNVKLKTNISRNLLMVTIVTSTRHGSISKESVANGFPHP